MKQRQVIFCMVIIMGMFSTACWLGQEVTVAPAFIATPDMTETQAHLPTAVPATATPMAEMPVLGSRSIQEKSTQPQYSIAADYAVLQGNPAAADPFNQAMDTFIKKTVSGFKQDAAQEPADVQTGGSYIDIHFSTTLVSSRAVSILYSVTVYYAGAAHPNSYLVSFNYDIAQKRMLVLKDLFKPGVDYLDLLSNFCSADLKKSLGESYFEEGTLPKDENFKNWSLQLDGLQIEFNPYQVGPYAVGPQKVMVPLDTLKNLLLPDGLYLK